jgi:two-component system, NtrC family, response regulator AtoC
MKYKILIVDDDEMNLMTTSSLLEQWGYTVETASDAKSGVAKGIVAGEYAVILLDYLMPDKNGDEVAKEIRAINKESAILMYSCDDSREATRRSLKAGAIEFVDKDEDLDVFKGVLENSCRSYEETSRLSRMETSKSASQSLISTIGMVGRSTSLAEVVRKTVRYKSRSDDVILLGESGTGKEMIAAALHNGPKDRYKAVNCAAFKDNTQLLESELFGYEKGAFTGAITSKAGIFESACGGTVFLDELHQLSLDAQAKLLRALQEKKIRRVGGRDEKKIDFRLITAAQTDLEERIAQGKFMLDLYHRVNVLKITIPPLRDRVDDIAPLIHHFCDKHYEKTGERKQFLAQTVRVMERYTWPGNVRELGNTVAALIADCNGGTVMPDHLDNRFRDLTKRVQHGSFSDLKNKHEVETRQFLTEILDRSDSVPDAAGKIGLPASTLYSMISRYGIKDGHAS